MDRVLGGGFKTVNINNGEVLDEFQDKRQSSKRRISKQSSSKAPQQVEQIPVETIQEQNEEENVEVKPSEETSRGPDIEVKKISDEIRMMIKRSQNKSQSPVSEFVKHGTMNRYFGSQKTLFPSTTMTQGLHHPTNSNILHNMSSKPLPSSHATKNKMPGTIKLKQAVNNPYETTKRDGGKMKGDKMGETNYYYATRYGPKLGLFNAEQQPNALLAKEKITYERKLLSRDMTNGWGRNNPTSQGRKMNQ